MSMTIRQASTLRNRPMEWAAYRGSDGKIMLKFKHPDNGAWQNVVTREGRHKVYSSADAMLNDINRIAGAAIVQFTLKDQIPVA